MNYIPITSDHSPRSDQQKPFFMMRILSVTKAVVVFSHIYLLGKYRMSNTNCITHFKGRTVKKKTFTWKRYLYFKCHKNDFTAMLVVNDWVAYMDYNVTATYKCCDSGEPETNM